MPAGRPTKYDPSMCADAIAFLSEGRTKEALAGKLGVTFQTLYNWIKEYPEFFEAIKEGEAASRQWWEDIGRRAVQGEITGFSAAAWIMSMKNMHGYRDKVEHTGEDGGAMVINIVRHAPD